jgi:hypothetical protein
MPMTFIANENPKKSVLRTSKRLVIIIIMLYKILSLVTETSGEFRDFSSIVLM